MPSMLAHCRARARPILPRPPTQGRSRGERNAICCGMPRDGSIILSDVRGPTLSIVCQPCGRRDRYSVQRLIVQHGDSKLTNLLETLANCPKTRSASIDHRCKAVYSGPNPGRRLIAGLSSGATSAIHTGWKTETLRARAKRLGNSGSLGSGCFGGWAAKHSHADKLPHETGA